AEPRRAAGRVAAVLPRACAPLEVGRPEIVRFTNTQHLAPPVSGELRQPAPSVLELAARLHPTPAINGSPPDAARRLISELEGMERGWDAGGGGWMEGRGDGELAGGIPCRLPHGAGAPRDAGHRLEPRPEPEDG